MTQYQIRVDRGGKRPLVDFTVNAVWGALREHPVKSEVLAGLPYHLRKAFSKTGALPFWWYDEASAANGALAHLELRGVRGKPLANLFVRRA